MEITKKDVMEALGLSCVENYFLAWLKQYYDVTKLYRYSFIGIDELFQSFSEQS